LPRHEDGATIEAVAGRCDPQATHPL